MEIPHHHNLRPKYDQEEDMFETLIDAEILQENLGRSDWVVIDTRFDLMRPQLGMNFYRQGHIPGAYYADLDQDLSGSVTNTTGRHPLPDPQDFVVRVNRWGVHANTQVVVYDGREGAIAARLWWLFRWMGHRAVAVLNGGFAVWQAAGFRLEAAVPPERPGRFEPQIQPRFVVDTDFIVRELLNKKTQSSNYMLFDARAEPRFRGEHEPIDTRAGHIPGAVNMPYQHCLDQDGRFLSAQQLKVHFQLLLAERSAQEVICMCGSGVTACHLLLALDRAGFQGARLYAGSWSEWIRDPGRPIETV